MGLGLLGASPPVSLDVGVDGLRSAKGLVQICLTARPKSFPGCEGDPSARRLSIPATEANGVRIEGLAEGSYALALVHDENGNARLDTTAGIPREGFGFSRNPAILFGPPRFNAARFDLESGAQSQRVKVRYML